MRNRDYIPTLDGWKLGEQLTVDDIIFDGNGNPQRINGIFRKKSKVKRLNLNNDYFIDCDDEESLFTNKRVNVNKTFELFSVKDIDKTYRNTRNNILYLDSTPLVKYIETKLPTEPYALGCLIGHAQKNYHADDLLRKYNLDGTIPKEYLMAPKRDRLSLLKGIIDTHSVFNTVYKMISFKSNNPLLINDIQELALSLGFIAFRKEYTNNEYFNYRYLLLINCDKNPYSDMVSEYDKWIVNDNKKKQYRRINSVIELGEEEILHPIIIGGVYLQGKQYIKKYFKND